MVGKKKIMNSFISLVVGEEGDRGILLLWSEQKLKLFNFFLFVGHIFKIVNCGAPNHDCV